MPRVIAPTSVRRRKSSRRCKPLSESGAGSHDDWSALDGFKDLFENAPCGYLVLSPDGRIAKVNQTLCVWTGYSHDQFAGKRVHQFLNIAGRIYYETHIAPLLRMQGFFNEFAIDMVAAADERVRMIATPLEGANAE